eukprot:TRINITY_DN139_c0_g1_i1.p1 TRINITY_DN139_c0_g1~~TRINITY_DN139_c0_g1_i1.p1  ORF type:complete len:395 (-),score=72.61 TRINITY_DN139_c0_g1_i1:61-1218(-)
MGNTPDGSGKAGDGENHHHEKKHKKKHKQHKRDKKSVKSPEYKSFVEDLDHSESIKHSITDDVHQFYEITETVLGVGNFSTVKLGICKKKGEKVAIKIIEKKSSKNKPEMLANEVGILLKVDHPNIIRMKDLFDSPNTLYLVMELVTGGELFDEIVKRDQYSEKDARAVMKQLLSAIAYLHEIGIVHRDLKPENLLLANTSHDSPIKLADFGLSKIYSEDMMMSTACGTPGYVAPEIVECNPYNSAVDLWAAGVIMYILLCGYPPFYDEQEQKLFDSIVKGKFEFHTPFWDHVSDSAKDLIRHLLVVDPEKRLTANQALEHEWFKKQAKNSTSSQRNVHESFKSKLSTHNSFRKAMSQSKKDQSDNRSSSKKQHTAYVVVSTNKK